MKKYISTGEAFAAIVLISLGIGAAAYSMGHSRGYDKAIEDVTVIIEKQINDEKDSN